MSDLWSVCNIYWNQEACEPILGLMEDKMEDIRKNKNMDDISKELRDVKIDNFVQCNLIEEYDFLRDKGGVNIVLYQLTKRNTLFYFIQTPD